MNSSKFTNIQSLIDKMIAYTADREETIADATTVSFWDDFVESSGTDLTQQELSHIYNELLKDNEDNEFLVALNVVLFLNWKYCPKYKTYLEFDHMKHIVFSWMVATEEEIENDVLLSFDEIGRRYGLEIAEYEITNVLPECLQEDYINRILAKVHERYSMETELVDAFETEILKKILTE